ncbi:MAG: S8 family serine peptidase [Cyanobacteria bacterium P01_A01_bin.105]
MGVPVVALSVSVGADGIDALRLHDAPYDLTGRKIAIGQVEIGRLGQFGIDKLALEDMPFGPAQVLQLDGAAMPDEFVDGHATNVASVMISQDKFLTGVAPDAVLFSAAVGPLPDTSGQPVECLTAQAVALRNSSDVRAINFSFGEPLTRDPRTDAVLDGNALLTQCIDWSNRVHDTLYVIAGNQGGGGIPIPTDNFNGINVAYSTQVDGQFTRVDYANLSSEPDFPPIRGGRPETNVGSRRSINLVAPGSNIEMFDPDGRRIVSSGTSFAATHVVATVALLQEYGDRQIRAGGWAVDAREPMVTKVVLLNSADKIQDTGDGLRLGMSRNILDEGNRTWVEGDAYRDQAIPLHRELGTGHLNAFRAYQQFSAGGHSIDAQPVGMIPAMGWAYDAIAPAEFKDYVFAQPLLTGSYLSATLAWERRVELNDRNNNGLYDDGESFTDRGLNNLDVYLMPADSEDLADSLWSSVSEADSVEHIFRQIPRTGRYKLRVVQRQPVNGDTAQSFALAWWGVSD